VWGSEFTAKIAALQGIKNKLGLELIQTQMAHKPILQAEVYARALHASQNVKGATGRFIIIRSLLNCTTIKYLRRATSGVAGNGLGTTIKYL
jgi:hypothetical protein